MNMNRSDLE